MRDFEAIKLIRQLEGYKLPFIVALTANASSGARDYYKSVGFDDYLSKPIDKFELDKILKRRTLLEANPFSSHMRCAAGWHFLHSRFR